MFDSLVPRCHDVFEVEWMYETVNPSSRQFRDRKPGNSLSSWADVPLASVGVDDDQAVRRMFEEKAQQSSLSCMAIVDFLILPLSRAMRKNRRIEVQTINRKPLNIEIFLMISYLGKNQAKARIGKINPQAAKQCIDNNDFPSFLKFAHLYEYRSAKIDEKHSIVKLYKVE